MDMETALRARLLAAAPIIALFGNLADERIAWVERPQETGLPAITLQNIVDARGQNMTGFDGLQPGYVQADGWASTYAEAKALKEAMIAALTPREKIENVFFDRAFVSARDLGEQGSTIFIHRQSLDFTFFYSVS